MAVTGTGSGTVGLQEFTQDLPPGILTHAFLTVDEPTLLPGDLWAELLIKQQGAPNHSASYRLAANYITLDNPVTWTGLLTIPSNTIIVGAITGLRTGTFYLTARRLTDHNIGDLGRFIRKLTNA